MKLGQLGERNHNARLTADAVRQLRDLRGRGWSLRQLGAEFGVHYSTVQSVVRGRTWRHVDRPPCNDPHPPPFVRLRAAQTPKTTRER